MESNSCTFCFHKLEYGLVSGHYICGKCKAEFNYGLLCEKQYKVFSRSHIYRLLLKEVVSNAECKRVLDVGCGDGELVKLLNGEGVSAYGIDVSLSTILQADQQISKYLSVMEIDEVVEEYDTIIYCDVLEHIVNPVDELKSAMSKLSPGGEIFVYIPVSDSFYYKLIKVAYLVGYRMPFFAYWATNSNYPHQFLPSRKALKKSARDLGLDLELIDQSPFSEANLLPNDFGFIDKLSFLFAKIVNSKGSPWVLSRYTKI